jgi:hypothetical protein
MELISTIARITVPPAPTSSKRLGSRKPIRSRLWAIFMTSVLLAACQIIPPQVVKSFSDDHDSMLVEDLKYVIGNSGLSITVPKGFVTDFASIPQFLWSLGLSPHGRYSKAAIVHDYLYWSQGCTKKQSDNILLIAMKESGVSQIEEIAIYDGVSAGGGSSWESNRNQKKMKLPRIIPTEYWNFPADATWKDYREYLVAKKVTDPSFPKNPPYCQLGNSTTVPK